MAVAAYSDLLALAKTRRGDSLDMRTCPIMARYSIRVVATKDKESAQTDKTCPTSPNANNPQKAPIVRGGVREEMLLSDRNFVFEPRRRSAIAVAAAVARHAI